MLDAPAVGKLPWSMDAIPYHALDREMVADDLLLLHTVASASFIEITSDLYTRNLVEFFAGDDDLVDWLTHGWEPEELQHGAALKRYVRTAWPDFDWESAYRGFIGEYSRFCTMGNLEASRALEMVARCVVETGTASFYRMLSRIAPEPVLREIADNIASDEVRHYKNFYHFYLRHAEGDNPGRAAVFRTLWSRALEVDNEDAYFAFKHVYLTLHPGAEFDRRAYEEFREGLRRVGREHFPYDMALKMFIQPLGFSAPVRRMVLTPAVAATRMLLLR